MKRRHSPARKSKSVLTLRNLRATGPLLLAATLAQGQQAPNGTASPPEEILVTATRSTQRLSQLGNAISVLDLETIEREQAISVPELLVRTPGVHFTRPGGVGQNTTVRIRGADADHTVLVIDGVRLNDPSTTGGGANLGELMVGDIARIEVLRGVQSTLWGSQAIGGVVNVTTATPTEPLSGNLRTEAGSYGTGMIKGGVGGRRDALQWRLAASHYDTEGISSLDTRLGGREKDGYRNTSASGTLRYDFTDALQLDLRGFYSDGKTELDQVSTNANSRDSDAYTLMESLIGYAGLNLALFDGRLQNRVSLQQTRNDGNRIDPAQANNPVTRDTLGRSKRIEYQGIADANDWLDVVFGLERERADVSYASPTAAIPNPLPRINEVGIDSAYLQLQVELSEALHLTFGTRRDDHDTFGAQQSHQVTAAWAFNDGNTLWRSSWGTGFKAPTMYQLFDARYGNPDAQPEEALDSWDTSVEQHFLERRAMVSAGYFFTKTKNLLVVTQCTAAPAHPLCQGTGHPGFYSNVDMSEVNGVELQGSLQLTPQWFVNTNYTYTRALDMDGNLDLPRTPRRMVGIELSYEAPWGLKAGFATRYVSDSFNDAANLQPLKGYALTDIRASYPLTDRVEVYGRVDNAFDRYYVTNLRYATLGRGAYAGVRVNF
ncbi:MAG TPA: TonB-dependent receptor [Hyphomicrobiales bacterium]|nr:TonB-dependent receptor [Hyphomicrobiales bacterium]